MINLTMAGSRLLKLIASGALGCAGLMAASLSSAFAEPQATQWYVSDAGNDVSNCGTSVDPCKTISYLLLLPAFAAGDQISVTDAITDNFTLTENATIAGAAGASIDGNGARIMTVDAGVSVTLNNLVLHNGGGTQDGGLIYNDGTLTINNATLTQSTLNGANGGAIYNAGMVTIANSTISNNAARYGGGIENQGVVFISTSTLANNRAESGAGVDNFAGGNVHLSRVILASNVATASGAAIFNDYGLTTRMWLTDTAMVSNTAQTDAGGVYNSGQISLLNVTISNNHIPGGQGLAVAISHQPDPFNSAPSSLTMQYVTIAGNSVFNANGSSAVNFEAPATIKNSVIANAGVDNCSGSITSAGYNMGSDGTCDFNLSTDANDMDARLGELQISTLAYGTFTNPPLRDSPLLNRIPSANCGSANDQRGVSRPQGDACDIGAHEVMPVDVGLTATSAPASLPAGTTLTVSLNVTNSISVIATGVVVTSNLPAGVGLKDCVGAASCVASGGRLTVTLGTLNAGANASVSVRLIPQQGGDIALRFNVGSNEWDKQMPNNAATANATVVKSADLSVRLNGTLMVQPHTTFTLTAEVENQSEFAADSPAFTLVLPANVSFMAAVGASWNCSQSAGAVSCVAQTALLARNRAQVVITLQSADAPAQLQFIGSATSNTFDPNTTNNSATVTVTVSSGSTIALPIVLR